MDPVQSCGQGLESRARGTLLGAAGGDKDLDCHRGVVGADGFYAGGAAVDVFVEDVAGAEGEGGDTGGDEYGDCVSLLGRLGTSRVELLMLVLQSGRGCCGQVRQVAAAWCGRLL